MIRCQTGRKFSIHFLITTSTSFGTVCTDGRDIVESADRGMKVFDKGQFDFFLSEALRIRSSFKRFLLLWFQSLGRSLKH